MDFRKKTQTPPPLVLQNKNVERVTSYKYLRVTITEQLDHADGAALVHEWVNVFQRHIGWLNWL